MLGSRSVWIDAVCVLMHLAGEFEGSGEMYSEDGIELLSRSGFNKGSDFRARNFKKLIYFLF